MLFKNVTFLEMYKALEKVNRMYDENIAFRAIEWKGKQIQATLKVKDSRGPGHRLGYTLVDCWSTKQRKGRRMTSACWHVHGAFFDALWQIAPNMKVRTGGFYYEGPADNWQDKDIGSMVRPYYFSEACECKK